MFVSFLSNTFPRTARLNAVDLLYISSNEQSGYLYDYQFPYSEQPLQHVVITSVFIHDANVSSRWSCLSTSLNGTASKRKLFLKAMELN